MFLIRNQVFKTSLWVLQIMVWMGLGYRGYANPALNRVGTGDPFLVSTELLPYRSFELSGGMAFSRGSFLGIAPTDSQKAFEDLEDLGRHDFALGLHYGLLKNLELGFGIPLAVDQLPHHVSLQMQPVLVMGKLSFSKPKQAWTHAWSLKSALPIGEDDPSERYERSREVAPTQWNIGWAQEWNLGRQFEGFPLRLGSQLSYQNLWTLAEKGVLEVGLGMRAQLSETFGIWTGSHVELRDWSSLRAQDYLLWDHGAGMRFGWLGPKLLLDVGLTATSNRLSRNQVLGASPQGSEPSFSYYRSPNLGVVLGLKWNWGLKALDRDKDGIPDELDQCPREGEDFDGFEDLDGCPELDNDKDQVLDVWDRCPLIQEDRDGFQDEDGCPEMDNDQDGIADAVDRCPDAAEDVDDFQDLDGCPDPDNDGDGVSDLQDRCSNLPEDGDGFEDSDGCPEWDNDQDGISDAKDQCPFHAEVFNGILDGDGCPDLPQGVPNQLPKSR